MSSTWFLDRHQSNQKMVVWSNLLYLTQYSHIFMFWFYIWIQIKSIICIEVERLWALKYLNKNNFAANELVANFFTDWRLPLKCPYYDVSLNFTDERYSRFLQTQLSRRQFILRRGSVRRKSAVAAFGGGVNPCASQLGDLLWYLHFQ